MRTLTVLLQAKLEEYATVNTLTKAEFKVHAYGNVGRAGHYSILLFIK